MRTWIVVALAAVGCEGKKNPETSGRGSGSQVVVVVRGDAAVAPPADAVVAPSDAVSGTPATTGDARLPDPHTLDYAHILDWETIGPLKIGMEGATVVELVGPPKRKSAVQDEAATGSFVSDWDVPAKGIVLGMAADKRSGPFRVRSIEIMAPSTFATSRGAKIGTKRAELPMLYVRDADGRDELDEYLVASDDGVLLFTMKDDKVVSIFLGPMGF